ncbi:Uncharacterised protein [Leminorella richardii]|uniref:Uncharacterized protein n=1 Tax=Leminorella richardii TaxID=158841 RepID=A0A2X4UWD2_9GAMM|nr:hypothetical protein [Leminorella richardii]SQI44176.1 Uncharacterised protein [Leminorella richardii]
MEKNEIYLDMLSWALPHLRNHMTLGIFSRIRDKSCYYESQLIHGFYLTLKYDFFNDIDIDFLNGHARHYYINCSEEKSMLYVTQIKNISKLFALVPDSLKSQLEWEGPSVEL